jgi:hypothetical protein
MLLQPTLDIIRRPKTTPSPRARALHALQGLLAASTLSLQAQSPGRAEGCEDLRERSAIDVVAGRARLRPRVIFDHHPPSRGCGSRNAGDVLELAETCNRHRAYTTCPTCIDHVYYLSGIGKFDVVDEAYGQAFMSQGHCSLPHCPSLSAF